MLVFLIFLSVSLFVALYGCREDETPEESHFAGQLDSSFGAKGIVITSIDSRSYADAMVLQPDGKIVVAGSASDGTTSSIALARYHPDGSLDNSFGLSGIARTSIDSSSSANAVVLQPDGKIVVAGSASDGTTSSIALAQYHPDGSLDITFGSGGIVTTSVGSDASAGDLAIQPDGKIVAVGPTSRDLTLVRYTPDGSLDTAFASTGIVTTSISSLGDSTDALAIQPDGKIVAAGSTSFGDLALVRYTTDGSLDITFGSGGIVSTSVGSGASASALVIQPDGKIVAAGYALTVHLPCDAPGGGFPPTFLGFWQTDFTLVRYTPNGSSDATVITDMGAIGDDRAIALAVQPEGKILAAGVASDRRIENATACILCFCSLTTEEINALVLPESFALARYWP
jgi:uncharacterized delta-60 repeat protein